MKIREMSSRKLSDGTENSAKRTTIIASLIIALLFSFAIFGGRDDATKTSSGESASHGASLGLVQESDSVESESLDEEVAQNTTQLGDSEATAEIETVAPSEPVAEEYAPDAIAEPAGLNYYRLDRVVDGDTIRVYYGGEVLRVRLIGVDTPETVHPSKPTECFGPQASDYMKYMLNGVSSVALEFDASQGQYDRYGRLLAYVYANGRQLNYEMIRKGYANEYTYNSSYKYRNEFVEAERSAKLQALGLWSAATCGGRR